MFEVNRAELCRLYFSTGLSLRQFAKSAGLNLLTVRNLIFGERGKTTGKVIATLAKYFGVDAESLLKKKGDAATA